jgi:hypothetical protein
MDGIGFSEGFGSGQLRKHCIVTLASMSDLLEQYDGGISFSQTFPKVPSLVRAVLHIFGSSSPGAVKPSGYSRRCVALRHGCNRQHDGDEDLSF